MIGKQDAVIQDVDDAAIDPPRLVPRGEDEPRFGKGFVDLLVVVAVGTIEEGVVFVEERVMLLAANRFADVPRLLVIVQRFDAELLESEAEAVGAGFIESDAEDFHDESFLEPGGDVVHVGILSQFVNRDRLLMACFRWFLAMTFAVRLTHGNGWSGGSSSRNGHSFSQPSPPHTFITNRSLGRSRKYVFTRSYFDK